VAFAVEGSVDAIQIRERDLEARELSALVTDVLALTRGSRTRVIVNDRLDVAIAVGADGVHLRSDSIAAQTVRPIVPEDFLIGRSVHSAGEVAEAQAGADYLTAGTVWPSRSKGADRRLLGVDGLASVVGAARVPVLAIGGVTLETLGQLAETGVAGAAAIDLFWPPAELGELCRAARLLEVVREARARFDRSR
jgi:thiamine-phosphate pyrophosphorylase